MEGGNYIYVYDTDDFMKYDEFVESFERTLKGKVVDLLNAYCNWPFLFTDLLQEFYLFFQTYVHEKIMGKLEGLSEVLGISLDNKNIQYLKELLRRFPKKLKDLTSGEIENMKMMIKETIHRGIKDYNLNLHDDVCDSYRFRERDKDKSLISIEEEVRKPEFEVVIRSVHEQFIFLELSEEEYKLPIKKKMDRLYILHKYNKNMFTCIEGFISKNVG